MREKLITERGKTNQADVASDIGIAQQYLSEIERGIKTPSAKLMNRIAFHYGKSVQELFPDIFLNVCTADSGIANQNEAS